MRWIIFQHIISLFIFHLVACNENRPSDIFTPDSNDMASDSLAILATLEGWYGAMYVVDSAGILAPLTPEFLLLEDCNESLEL